MTAQSRFRITLLCTAICAGAACSWPLHAEQRIDRASITHGVAVGDVRSDRAVIWSRADRESTMHVRVKARDGETLHERRKVTAAHDYAGTIELERLKPDTAYEYAVWFDDDERGDGNRRDTMRGTFRTAPKAQQAMPVEFAWGGDVAGQNVCRDASEGFPIFTAINRLDLDFFVGLGDMIYADGVCAATGLYGNAQVVGPFDRAANLADFWAHWKYNREDNAYRALLGKVPYYAIWDDHEVVNDFGPLHDTRTTPPYTAGAHLLPLGLQAFLDYNPIAQHADTPQRLYRTVRWGKQLELFILDTRQYRDANLGNDDAERPKTMLGREQLHWLKQKLAASDATWKIIVSSVPMSIPTGFPPELGRDGWANFDQATGFEYELLDVLRHMKERGMYNVAFITTDVHFAEVFRYTPFAEDASFKVHEFVSGPLNAGLFPNRDYDATLNAESLFFHGPGAAVTNYADAKPWMNFGHARVDENGRLTVSIRDVNGAVVYEKTLEPR
jgi:alkaline phosphatase D